MAIIGLKNLCTPASVYLVISTIALFFMAAQNFGNVNLYCLGTYSCEVSNTTMIFIIKILYIAFWTWILNLMCRSGASTVAWLLVLFPIILLFLILALMMIR